MAVDVNDKIRKLATAQRKRTEIRAAELIAEFPDRAPVVLSGIAEDK
jgi:hypothetical protein